MNSQPQSQNYQPDQENIAYTLHGNCYINLTSKCTLRCAFCPKFNGSWEVQDYNLRLFQEPTVEEVVKAVGVPTEYNQIVYCGLGEPTLRLDALLESAAEFKRISPATPIRINTDGLASLVYGYDVTPRFKTLIDRLSISLNAHNEELYNKHCRPKYSGAYSALLDFIAKAKFSVSDVTVTAIEGLPGVDIDQCARQAKMLGVNFRKRFMDQVG